MGRSFHFQLESVLKQRKVQEDLAQRDFQLAVANLRVEEQKLSKMFEQVEQARQKSFEAQTHETNPASTLEQINHFLSGQKIRIERQRQRIVTAESQVENFREILRQAVVAYKMIERLKERRLEEFKKETQKLEQKAADDLSTMRFRRV